MEYLWIVLNLYEPTKSVILFAISKVKALFNQSVDAKLIRHGSQFPAGPKSEPVSKPKKRNKVVSISNALLKNGINPFWWLLFLLNPTNYKIMILKIDRCQWDGRLENESPSI